MTYSALKSVSAPSVTGFLSVTAIFFIIRALNGLTWIFSKVISPSRAPASRSAALSAMYVWTSGSWIASIAASVRAVSATNVSQIILSIFLIPRNF